METVAGSNKTSCFLLLLVTNWTRLFLNVLANLLQIDGIEFFSKAWNANPIVATNSDRMVIEKRSYSMLSIYICTYTHND